MNCCDYKCEQGRDCPARHRRVKAGGPPPTEIPSDPVERDGDAVALGTIETVITITVFSLGVMFGYAFDQILEMFK